MLSARLLSTPVSRYLAAVSAVGIAVLIRSLLSPVLGNDLAYITLFVAVAFSAWFCGVGPSVLAAVVGVLAARYWLLDPLHSFAVPDIAQSIGMMMFLFNSSIIIAFGEISRRSNEKLKAAQHGLERTVEQRTIELKTANEKLRELTGHVLHLQDEERRRIARELHDSAGQSLVALSMDLGALDKEARAAIDGLTSMVKRIGGSTASVQGLTTDIRTISYLLHPPLLDEAGLPPALEWYIRGFSERSNITVDLDFAEDFGRLPTDLETAIFRVVQECLVNIHRHSESPVASIRIERIRDEVHLKIQDQGKGFAEEQLSEASASNTFGVGIRGMRERILQLGGTLEIDSEGLGKGTVVTVLLPVAETRAKVAAASAS